MTQHTDTDRLDRYEASAWRFTHDYHGLWYLWSAAGASPRQFDSLRDAIDALMDEEEG